MGINAVDCMIVEPTNPNDDEEMALLVSKFEAALNDDLDTPKALDVLRELDVIAGEKLKNKENLAPISGMYSLFQCVLGVFS